MATTGVMAITTPSTKSMTYTRRKTSSRDLSSPRSQRSHRARRLSGAHGRRLIRIAKREPGKLSFALPARAPRRTCRPELSRASPEPTSCISRTRGAARRCGSDLGRVVEMFETRRAACRTSRRGKVAGARVTGLKRAAAMPSWPTVADRACRATSRFHGRLAAAAGTARK